ncbi:dGTP triphosphohydrolase [Arthrospiribacter ruber]|uniref:DNTP triphosphohydrolase n=1 Tax=Arthrospiribacter ruber TaxID=2487934 RepID=A0A951IXQ6_9BACT|nr:dNTP triphosphohydrolase [Arthrospiribacter ruber]MBW3469125.1 dNTP triphosphohydrolase [Arthrospiribacter ruber]
MMNWQKLLTGGRFEHKDGSIATETQNRSEFERDYDRVIFSAPFRNLQDKTQVFPLPEHDFVHTRLTHSLEVSSVGRSLGKAAGDFLLSKYPELHQSGISASDLGAIVAAAALSHDIGNPPFGHAGEEAISDFFKHHPYGYIWQPFVSHQEWEDLCQFEGNAQGFRMLVSQHNGLKLTFATLAAFTKYPRPSYIFEKDSNRRSHKKFGFFIDQKKDFEMLASTLGLEKSSPECYFRHPLAFLVEAADDICYSIIDLEDGATLGLVSFEESVDLLGEILGQRYQPDKLKKYATPTQKLAVLRAMAIGQLIEETVEAFCQSEEQMLSGEFDQALTEIIPSAKALGKISRLSVQKIYRSKPVLEKEAAGYQVLEGLLEVFSKALNHKFYQTEMYAGKDKSILRLLPEGFPMEGWGNSQNAYPMLRALVDFISGMTDKHALSLYRKVKGIALPGV